MLLLLILLLFPPLFLHLAGENAHTVPADGRGKVNGICRYFCCWHPLAVHSTCWQWTLRLSWKIEFAER